MDYTLTRHETCPRNPASSEYKNFSDEIDAFITLGPEKCPGEGSVYYKDTTEDRCWHCDYQKRNPVVLGFDR